MRRLQRDVVLVTDARGSLGRALVAELLAADVRRVYIGAGESPSARVVVHPIDLRERSSVVAASHRLTDVTVVIDTASSPGAPPVPVGGGDLSAIVEALDRSALGLARIAAAFIPTLAAAPEGVFAAVVSVQAWANVSGAHGVAQAARLSLLDALRIEVMHTGISVIAGMTECESDPSTMIDLDQAQLIAGRLIDGLAAGQPEVLLDAQARSVKRRLCGPLVDRYPELG
jgi:NADP-dependent 3-hydroxy acid dehydrogenase YdfG